MKQYLKDESFQPSHAQKSDLLIELSQTCISYAIVDQIDHQVCILFSTEINHPNSKVGILEKLDELLDTNSELKLTFRKVKVSLTTFQFTFIPQELFNPSLTREYSKYIQNNKVNNSTVYINDIKPIEAKNIFTLDSELQEIIHNRFSQALLFNQANSFITGVNKAINIKGVALAFNIQAEIFQVALFEDGRLIFYNLFDCINADEFNYFILKILTDLNIEADQATVLLSGSIENDDLYYYRLQKYFKGIQFLNEQPLSVRINTLNLIEPYRFFSLLSLNICE